MNLVTARPTRFVCSKSEITEIPFYLPRPKRFVASTTTIIDTEKK
jgi:hypothetical protein